MAEQTRTIGSHVHVEKILSDDAIDAVAKLMALEHVRANGTEAEYDWEQTEDAWKRSFRLRARKYLTVAADVVLENA